MDTSHHVLVVHKSVIFKEDDGFDKQFADPKVDYIMIRCVRFMKQDADAIVIVTRPGECIIAPMAWFVDRDDPRQLPVLAILTEMIMLYNKTVSVDQIAASFMFSGDDIMPKAQAEDSDPAAVVRVSDYTPTGVSPPSLN